MRRELGLLDKVRASIKAFSQPTNQRQLFSSDGEFSNQQLRIDYRKLIENVSNRYNVRIQDGAQETRLLIDFRADWITGNGLDVTAKSAANKEFLKRFIDYNRIDSTGFRHWAIGGEIEGRQLLFLSAGKNESENGPIPIKVSSYSWLQSNYSVLAKNSDPEDFDFVEIPNGTEKPIRLPYENTVYVKLESEERFVNSPVPVAAVCDLDISAIADAYSDLRRFCRKIGAGFVHYETQNMMDADELMSQAQARKWKIGTLSAGPAKAYYVVPGGDARENIIQEILRRTMRVSGVSGVPVHFFGLIDQFGTKAGADTQTQILNYRTANQRIVWKHKLEELFKKAIILDRQLNVSALVPDDVEVEIPEGTVDNLELLTTVFLPLYQGGLISSAWLRGKIPNYDSEDDEQNLEDDDQKRQIDQQSRLDMIGKDLGGFQ